MPKTITEKNVASFIEDGKLILEEDDSISPQAIERMLRDDITIYQMKRMRFRELEAVEEALETMKSADEAKGIERVFVTVIGQDTTGIIASITQIFSTHNVNILDISQTILDDLFAMIMIGDISTMSVSPEAFKDELVQHGEAHGLKINIQHENLFNYMHRI